MKIALLKFRTLAVCCLILGLVAGGVCTASEARKEKTILVTPFEVTAEENLDFLKKGIEKMLEARLTEPGRSKVVLGDGQSADADYIITGNILIFGSQVSTDVKLLHADNSGVALSFNDMGETRGDVLRHIDAFADNIRVKTLGLPPAAALNSPVVQQATQAQMSQGRQPAGVYQPEEIWRGPFIDAEVLSLTVSDLDGDGRNETLVLTNQGIDIYRRDGETLAPVSQNPLDLPNIRYLFVDTMDVDQDGSQDVCITGIDDKNLRAASFVYRVENMHLVRQIGPASYFLRVMKTVDGPVLLGQETRGSGGAKLRRSRVVQLAVGNGGGDLVETGEAFSFADNVFGMAFGDFLNNGEESVAVLGLNGNISIFDKNGSVIYRGSEDYGGTQAYLEYKGMRYTRDDGFKLDRLYLQQRLFAADLDGDGKINLISVKNVDSANGLLDHTRIFTRSYIDVLVWNELGLASQDRSQALSGYVSDFTVADMNSDGKEEVVFALLSKNKLLKDARTQLFSRR